MEHATQVEYTNLDFAYQFFNRRLFQGALPDCLITLQRKHSCYGYFGPSRLRNRNGERRIDEIALNPNLFHQRSDIEILATLVHEMLHCWQQHFGHYSGGGYHNRQWAERTKSVGLYPSSTGAPGGAETGFRVSHYVLVHGPFHRLALEIVSQGFQVQWQDQFTNFSQKKISKVKYTCPLCRVNAWAKPRTRLLCGDCLTRLTETH